jgi:hypothetical protein
VLSCGCLEKNTVSGVGYHQLDSRLVCLHGGQEANSLEIDDLTKAMNGIEADCLDVKRKFVARPDMKNPRTCDSVGQTISGMVKNGKFQVTKIVSIDENYEATIRSFGLEDVYKLKK